MRGIAVGAGLPFQRLRQKEGRKNQTTWYLFMSPSVFFFFLKEHNAAKIIILNLL
jgi:hypothetical protein